MNAPVLEVSDLAVHFSTDLGVAEVVNGVSLAIQPGEIHGLVGESGSGKSMTARSILGLLPRKGVARKSGSIRLDGEEILDMSENELRERVRGRKISMVFQDPMTALNPVLRIGDQIALPLRRHLGLSRKVATARAVELLEQVGVPEPQRRVRSFPHELSGGQRQRVMIAIALACDPAVLIADEPTTALDVTVQAQILDLFDKLRRERDLAILLVSHDLALIAERCDLVSVMYAGRIVETGPAKPVFAAPAHPYSELLERARPQLSNPQHTVLETIPGRPPSLIALPQGCAFAARCPRAAERCVVERPRLEANGPTVKVACHLPVSPAQHDDDEELVSL